MSLLAWLKAQRPEKYNDATQKAVGWIGKQRGGYGGFGSTQSTILALKALIAYANANKKTAEAGEVVLSSRARWSAGRPSRPAPPMPSSSTSKDAEKLLHAGKNKLSVEITGKSSLPLHGHLVVPDADAASADKCRSSSAPS